jgi:Ca-activated chloride channel family protein
MLAADLKPSRLVRARFKVEDILAHDEEGQTGLVVFAGDAFTVSPLTRDADTIRAQLRALDPAIMPSQGSRADLGLLKAQELLQQAEVKQGQVVLIADGVEGNQTAGAAGRLRAAGYEVSVLGVGTRAGAPIPDGRGGTLRDNSGKPLLAALDDTALAAVAKAGGGHYSGLHGDQSDLDIILRTRVADGDSVDSDDLQAQKWKGQGPLLAVLILPLAALAFRRGWMFSVLLCAGTLAPMEPAMAFGWAELWQRQDQQAAQALHNGEYEQAARLAEDPAYRGSALYRQGDYEKAIEEFERMPDADASYNRGNALARLSKYKDAISAYDRALELRPDMEDALANKAAVEALLNQQQKDKEPSDQQNDRDQSSEQEQQQGSSTQDDPEQEEQSKQADSGDSGDQEASSPPDEQQASQGQSGEEENAGQKDQDAQADSGGSGDQENPSQSDEQQASQAQKGEQERSAQQEQDAQADAGSSGNQESRPQSDGEEPPETQTGARHDAEQAQSKSENQFADANRELDKGRDDEQAEREPGPSGQESEPGQQGNENGFAQQSPSTDQRQQTPEPSAEAEALNSEEQMAAQRWLRRIPDDPGGLLRRKFLYQYRQRARSPDGGSQQGW